MASSIFLLIAEFYQHFPEREGLGEKKSYFSQIGVDGRGIFCNNASK